ncbi:DUF2752 domain-containing protein [Streptomyces sp. NBC_01408]|uniref:DUF2752 domain-containing protein n=1 Tax=Streptomyces sp. NBC_01408 TaxID=2903855 RepID=UPI00224F46F0|nr:DUF2752 domain-containing protein [Streptomyces sp. NBC_01408]MCX4693851.1 DUF2752 domain-containing protein [Streptomyces sp. NBC_01408]
MTGENQRVDASRTPDAAPSPGPAPAPGVPSPGPAPVPAVPSPGLPPAPVVPAAGPVRSRARRLAAPVLVLAGAVAAFGYVGAVDPNEPGHYPVCPLLRLTGILCPGCGGLRSAHAFAHGDLLTASGANALAVVGYFVFAGFMALWLFRAARGGPVPRIVLKPPYWWGIGAAALVFAVIRNLSFGSALAP